MPNDIVVLSVIALAFVVLAIGVRAGIRRGPTLAQRYLAASPEAKRRLDAKMNESLWLRAKMQPLSIWSVVGGLVLFILFVAVKAWLAN